MLAATEIYVGLTTERADRPPFSDADAAAELRRLESDGVLEPRATRAVLVAAGHGEPAAAHRGERPENPGGLSRREVDVLRPRRARASRRARSPIGSSSHPRPPITTSSTSTRKIGVSTRAAAALWAMQHDVVR